MTELIIILGVAAVAAGVGLIVGLLVGRPKPSTGPQAVTISPKTQDELNADIEASYRERVKLATADFGEDLSATSKRLSEQVERLTTEVITTELEQYQKTLEGVRSVAAGTATQIQQAVEEQQTKLRQSMETMIQEEQTRRLAIIDTRMGEIVSGYITESLGAGVDLGAQADYIVASLEARREDIKRDLSNGL